MTNDRPMSNTTNQPGEDELDEILRRIEHDYIVESPILLTNAEIRAKGKEALLEWQAAHQTAHTDALVKKLEAEKHSRNWADTDHEFRAIDPHNAALDTAIVLVKGGEA